MAHYRIKNWSEFQHYKDRSPPWIKLHRGTLTSRTWVNASDSERVLAVACMLVAADTDNKIPADSDYIQRVAYLNCPPDFGPLLRNQFIEFVDDSGEVLAHASTPQASDTKRSSEERRGEERRARKRASRVPDDFKPDLDYARSQLPDIDAEREAQKFRDWEFKTPRSDWAATWRNWIGTCRDSGKYARKSPDAKPDGSVPTFAGKPMEWR